MPTKTEAIQNLIRLQPKSVDELYNIFPWQVFDKELELQADTETDIVIAEKVTVQANAEVKRILICDEAVLMEGAEILGTIICRSLILKRDAECNFVICESLKTLEDAEIKSAMVSSNIILEAGTEINELDALETIKADLSDDCDIFNINKISRKEWDKMIPTRIGLVLATILEQGLGD